MNRPDCVTTTHLRGADDDEQLPGDSLDLPSEASIDRSCRESRPSSGSASPNLPAEGALLAGNHAVYGFLDLPVHDGRDREAPPRGGDLLAKSGMVRGTRDKRPGPDARPVNDPGLPRRLARGQQATRPAAPAPVERAASASPGSRSSTATRSSRSRRWGRRHARRDHGPKHADMRPAGPRLRRAHGVPGTTDRARRGPTPIPARSASISGSATRSTPLALVPLRRHDRRPSAPRRGQRRRSS